jgi:hypothetical protein
MKISFREVIEILSVRKLTGEVIEDAYKHLYDSMTLIFGEELYENVIVQNNGNYVYLYLKESNTLYFGQNYMMFFDYYGVSLDRDIIEYFKFRYNIDGISFLSTTALDYNYDLLYRKVELNNTIELESVIHVSISSRMDVFVTINSKKYRLKNLIFKDYNTGKTYTPLNGFSGYICAYYKISDDHDTVEIDLAQFNNVVYYTEHFSDGFDQNDEKYISIEMRNSIIEFCYEREEKRTVYGKEFDRLGINKNTNLLNILRNFELVPRKEVFENDMICDDIDVMTFNYIEPNLYI